MLMPRLEHQRNLVTCFFTQSEIAREGESGRRGKERGREGGREGGRGERAGGKEAGGEREGVGEEEERLIE